MVVWTAVQATTERGRVAEAAPPPLTAPDTAELRLESASLAPVDPTWAGWAGTCALLPVPPTEVPGAADDGRNSRPVPFGDRPVPFRLVLLLAHDSSPIR